MFLLVRCCKESPSERNRRTSHGGFIYSLWVQRETQTRQRRKVRLEERLVSPRVYAQVPSEREQAAGSQEERLTASFMSTIPSVATDGLIHFPVHTGLHPSSQSDV